MGGPSPWAGVWIAEDIELSAAPIIMALVHAYDILIAISHPEHGVIMMPEQATPDEDDRELWLPYLVGGAG